MICQYGKWAGLPDWREVRKMEDNIPDIAQKLYEEDDKNGNLYKQEVYVTAWYEALALELLDKITDIRRDNVS